MTRRKKRPVPVRTQSASDVLADLSEWLTPHEYEQALPKFASRAAILRDIHLRKYNGLDAAGVCRKVGRRFLIHKTKYTAFRLGVLEAAK